jgi:hypothetical protein
MAKGQRIALLLAAVAIIATVVVPPWSYVDVSPSNFAGYSWIWAPIGHSRGAGASAASAMKPERPTPTASDIEYLKNNSAAWQDFQQVFGMLPPGFEKPKPTSEDIDLLKKHPEAWQDFQKAFGVLPQGFDKPKPTFEDIEWLKQNPTRERVENFRKAFGEIPSTFSAGATEDELNYLGPHPQGPGSPRLADIAWHVLAVEWVAILLVAGLATVSLHRRPSVTGSHTLPGASIRERYSQWPRDTSSAKTMDPVLRTAAASVPKMDSRVLTRPALTEGTTIAGPWPRFWARMIDVYLEVFLLTAIAALLTPWVVWIVLPAAMLLDAAVYAMLGNTLGKAILGIRVRTDTHEPERLEFLDYLVRNLTLFLYGLALGILPMTLGLLIRNYIRAARGEPMRWDRIVGSQPITVSNSALRTTLGATIFLLVVTASAVRVLGFR